MQWSSRPSTESDCQMFYAYQHDPWTCRPFSRRPRARLWWSHAYLAWRDPHLLAVCSAEPGARCAGGQYSVARHTGRWTKVRESWRKRRRRVKCTTLRGEREEVQFAITHSIALCGHLDDDDDDTLLTFLTCFISSVCLSTSPSLLHNL